MPIKRGQVVAAEEFLSKRWKWSRGKVRRFLDYLASETVQQIVQQKNKVISIYTIPNYEAYQSNGTTDGTTDGHQTVQQTDDRQYTPKKDKKVKKDKNEIKSLSSLPAEAVGITEKIVKHVFQLNPNSKNLRSEKINATKFAWATSIERAHRLDARSWEELNSVFAWASRSDFWQSNILSGDALRKQFDQLKVRMDADTKPRKEKGKRICWNKSVDGIRKIIFIDENLMKTSADQKTFEANEKSGAWIDCGEYEAWRNQ